MKKTLHSEISYILALIFLAVGVTLMEKADFGLSMVVAPAYLLHRWVSPTFSFFTFGMAEYCFQAILLVIMTLVLRKFKLSYLFSFVTAVVYGFVLDGFMYLLSLAVPGSIGIAVRLAFFVFGMISSSIGVSLMFHTYISAEVYELFVKEVSLNFKVEIHKFKTFYDIGSCLVAVIMSFLIFGFGHFEGIKLGTIFCTFVNGYIISLSSKFIEKHFEIKDFLPLRKYF